MLLHLPAGAPLHARDGLAKSKILDLGHTSADLADHMVVMVRRQTGHVRMLARRQIDTLEQSKVREEVERAEDRGPADAKLAGLGLSDDVVGGEVAGAAGDELGHDTPRLSEPVASGPECVDKGIGSGHLRPS